MGEEKAIEDVDMIQDEKINSQLGEKGVTTETAVFTTPPVVSDHHDVTTDEDDVVDTTTATPMVSSVDHYNMENNKNNQEEEEEAIIHVNSIVSNDDLETQTTLNGVNDGKEDRQWMMDEDNKKDKKYTASIETTEELSSSFKNERMDEDYYVGSEKLIFDEDRSSSIMVEEDFTKIVGDIDIINSDSINCNDPVSKDIKKSGIMPQEDDALLVRDGINNIIDDDDFGEQNDGNLNQPELVSQEQQEDKKKVEVPIINAISYLMSEDYVM